jgi:uncharacterized protein YjbJ (UPF0337 family)
MNKDELLGRWRQMKGEVQTQWGKLTSDDLDQINGNLDKLVEAVQWRYGYAWERAEKEVEAFRKQQVRAAAGPGRATPPVEQPSVERVGATRARRGA